MPAVCAYRHGGSAVDAHFRKKHDLALAQPLRAWFSERGVRRHPMQTRDECIGAT
jgi:hypothetical protein